MSKPDPMVALSEAMRSTIEQYAPTIRDLSDEDLRGFWIISGAYAADLRAERERRSNEGGRR